MSNLFISHSSRDNAAAKELQARLEEQGHRSVFLDLDPAAGIQAGVSWERTLYTKLRACRAVVALCSDSYLASQWCFAEIALARMEGKELFVLQIDPWSEGTQMPSILTEEQFIDLRTNKDDGYKRLWNGFKVKGIVPEEQRQWGPDDPPYPGLRAFDESDAPIFFGREPEVREGVELLNRVRRQGHPRLVMVLGSSGSGKSSLARAGLLPRLRRDGNRWLVVGPFRPGRQPARKLAEALSQAFDRAGQARPWEPIHRQLTSAAPARPTATASVGAGATTGQADPARQRLRQALSSLAGELTDADAKVARSVRRLEEFLAASPPAEGLPIGAPEPASIGSSLVELASELRLLRGAPEASVLVLVDQFEELLGHEGEGAEDPANRFLEQLRESLEAEDSPLLALATMRSDYLGMLQRSAPLQGFGFKSLSVGPMSPAGMKEIIEKPALLGQLQLGDGLTERMLGETGSSDALPLLAFTLRVMWDRYHEGRALEMEHYEAIGRLEGAVARVAEDTLEAALEIGEEDRLRDAFLSLARPAAEGSGWSRQPVRWDDLDEAVQPMLQCFIDQRLLVKRGDGTVEVAHEALFRSWKTLRGWLDENAEGLHLRSEIQVDAARWAEAVEGEKATYLWRGGRLARAFELRESGVLPLEDVDRSFIEASDHAERAQAEEEEARRRMVLRGALVFAAVVLVLFAAATWQWVRARQARDDARWQALQATVGRLASQTLNKLDSQHDLALLLSVQATRMAPSAEAQSSLMQALQHNPRLESLFHGHAATVRSVAYSAPDGSLRASGGGDGRILLWDVARAELVGAPFEGHVGEVMSVAFSPDGAHLVSGGEDRTVRLWDVKKGVQLGKPLEGHEQMVRVVVFGPDGTLMASGDEGGTVLLWAVAGGGVQLLDPPLEGQLESVRALAFHPDDQELFATGEGGLVRWRLGFEAPPGELLHEDWANFLALSRNGRRLAWGGYEESIRLWKLEKGQKGEALCEWHAGEVWTGAFDSDGEIFASGGSDGKVRLWAVEGCRESDPPLEGHQNTVLSVAFDPDPPNGPRLASASSDKTIRLWSLDTTQPLGRALPRSSDMGSLLTSLAFSPNGTLLASGGDVLSEEDPELVLGEITLWEMDGEIRLSDRQLEGPFSGGVESMAFSPDSKRLAAVGSGADGLWDVETRRPLRAPEGQEGEVLSLAFSQDAGSGYRRVSLGSDRIIRSWSPAREERTHGLEGQPTSIGTVERLRVPTTVRPHFSPDGRLLAYGDDDETLRLWDVEASRQLEPALGDLEGLSSLAFDPAGKVLASATSTKVLLWDASARTPLAPPLEAHVKDVTSVAFSPDMELGLRLASGGADKTVRLWDVGTHRPLDPPFEGHEHEVKSVAFSPDGKLLASGDFSSNVMLWDVDLESWRAKACRIANRNLSVDEWSQFMPQREYACTCESLPPDPEAGLAACP